jgi:DNA-binding XRE family transcriptional regulator
MDGSVDGTPSTDRFRGQVMQRRGRAGLTQRALAAHLGISEQAIGKWEAGEGYREVLRQVAESEHQSSLLLTGGRRRPSWRCPRRRNRS